MPAGGQDLETGPGVGLEESSDESFSDEDTEDKEELRWHKAEFRHGVLDAFKIMELRRMRRVQNGRVARRGLGSHVSSAIKGLILAFMVAKIFDITTTSLGIREWWAVPAVLTAALVLPALARTLQQPEHTFTVWVSTEVYIFCLWISWWYDPHLGGEAWCLPTTRAQVCFNQMQFHALEVFAVVIGVTMILYIPHRVILPCAVRFHCCLNGRVLLWWRDVRHLSTEPGCWQFTYKPSGVLSWSRAEFMYAGEVDDEGRPHGEGLWYDTSFHGECLRGHWVHGAPAGAFYSREMGTGAQFLQCAIGYVTSRADCPPDKLSTSACIPRKDSILRFGLGHVEASFAGGFFPFLPSVEYSQSMDTLKDLVEELVHSYNFRQEKDRQSLRLETISGEQFKMQAQMSRNLHTDERLSTVPVQFTEGDRVGYVSDEVLLDIRSPSKPEALVFIHGFNCDVATALGRVAQTFSLGSMESHIIPFVFSYAGGMELTYFQARNTFPDYGADLASFLTQLAEHFHEVHILTHSCGAEFFLANWSAISGCFMPSKFGLGEAHRSTNGTVAGKRWVPQGRRGSGQDRRLHLATLTMLNPDVLHDMVLKLLPEVMEVAEHFTAYNDSNDGALFWSGMVRGAMSLLFGGRCRAPRLFGKSVKSMWLEQVQSERHLSGDAMHKRDRKHAPVFRRQAFSSGSLLRRPEVPGDGCIDIIDCSNIDQNVHDLRHNYYMLNTQMVEDVCELIGLREKAAFRSRLCQHGDGNVFSFLSPPSYLKE